MDPIEQARSILHIAKALRAYSADESKLNMYFEATRLAGRAGLFASAIKGFDSKETALSSKRARALYADAGIDRLTYQSAIRPWLEKHALAYFIKGDDGEERLVATVLTYDALLKAVTALYDDQATEDSAAELACHVLLSAASRLPITQSAALKEMAAEVGDERAQLGLQLATGYRLVRACKPSAKADAVLYTDSVWERFDERAARALSGLKTDSRAALEAIVEKVRSYQGYPEELVRKWTKENNCEGMLDLAIGVNLITRTSITRGDGSSNNFLTTPHFYADVRDEFGGDNCDRLKIFLDSIRNGQHFSSSGRGKIKAPRALLSALLDRGSVGPATAIGEDYALAERAGVVRVERSGTSSRYNLVPVQKDVIKKTLEVIDRQALSPSAATLKATELEVKGTFVSIPENSVRLAPLQGEMREAEQDLLRALRED